MMLASPAAAGAIHVAPVYRKDVKRPADADLRRVCSLTRSLLPSDGVELPFENMALLNTPRIRSVVLSEMWVHATHERALRFFVHAVAAPADGDDLFLGVTEASLPWCDGQTEGVDCHGRMRRGPSPLQTVRNPFQPLPKPAPKTATFTITIDFRIGLAAVSAYPDYNSAKDERNQIFEHNIDVTSWGSARLWITTCAHDTLVCLAKVKYI